MATGQLNGVLGHLRRMAQDGGPSDGQLLERFRSQQEEAAFEGLVHRFGPMVLGVCRRVLGHRDDAEDAFQATFLVLLRKARTITQPELVGNWLYGVAFWTARNLRASRARRRAAERQVPAMPRAQPQAEREVWSDLQPVLDEELSRLPEKYRAPVVLCELHGKSRKEAARQLGCAEGTLSSRLARARQLLRKRLARRGLALSAAALASVLVSGTASASVPAPLVIHTVKAAMQIAAGQAAAAAFSPQVVALTEGVLKTMFLIKLKTVTAICVVVAMLAGGAGLFTRYALADKQDPVKKEAPADAPKKEAPADAPKKEAPDQEQPKKDGKKEQGPDVQGMVQGVDAGKNTITLTVPVPGTKQTEEKTFDLAKDVKVLLNNSVTKEQTPEQGKLTDLEKGTAVSLHLSADKKAVNGITARGPNLQGIVKSVDAGKNTITITAKSKESKALEERTLELAKDARIILNNNLPKAKGEKGEPGKEAKLTDLTEGTQVSLQLSVDQKKVLAVLAQGATVQGEVKSVDAGNNTITLTLAKKDGSSSEQTFTVCKDAKIDGKLSDLKAGTAVSMQICVVDRKTVVAIYTAKKKEKEDE